MRHVLAFSLMLLLVTSVSGQTKKARAEGKEKYPPEFSDAKEEVYKTINGTQLKLFIFNPERSNPTEPRPAVVFFFGGGWTNGSPGQFQNQCRYLASRGMVAITADYRVASRQNVKAVDCVRDAKSAIRYVRENAARLGVDPQHIAAGGGSAGGHIAACTGTIIGLDEEGENTAISSVPNAMVLFNPVMSWDGLTTSDEEAHRRRTSWHRPRQAIASQECAGRSATDDHVLRHRRSIARRCSRVRRRVDEGWQRVHREGIRRA